MRSVSRSSAVSQLLSMRGGAVFCTATLTNFNSNNGAIKNSNITSGSSFLTPTIGIRLCSGADSSSGPSMNARLLVNKHPEIAAEVRQTDLLTTLTYDSPTLVSWTCAKCQNPWNCSPLVRSIHKTHACPSCRKGTAKKFVTSHPALAKEWSTTKNDAFVDKNSLTVESKLPVWWECKSCQQPYKSRIVDRVKNLATAGCPGCSVKIVRPLASTEFVRMWHPTANGDSTSDKVNTKSPKMSWWMCDKCSSEWQAKVIDVCSGGSACPECVPDVSKKKKKTKVPPVAKRSKSSKSKDVAGPKKKKPVELDEDGNPVLAPSQRGQRGRMPKVREQTPEEQAVDEIADL